MSAILDAEEIRRRIPHRPPFLFVDSVELVEEERKAVGTKRLSPSEDFFRGHFPGHPVMPGVLILEALAQTAGVLLSSRIGERLAYFIGIEDAKFRAPVPPGAELKLHATLVRFGGRIGRFRGEAFLDGRLAAEASMTFALVDKGAQTEHA